MAKKLHVNSARKPYAPTLPVIKPQKLVKRVKRRCARKSMNANHTPKKPHCRNEGKKVCHVEQKTQPKQIKKYS